MKNIITIVVAVLMIDLVGFILWSASGQFPMNNIYIGVITKTILSLVI